jgi:uncharacterized protein (DUF58 family)
VNFVATSAIGRTESTLRLLELQVNRRLDGLLQGDHLGLVPAPGTEPGEGREYVVGDDVRRIDWNLTARTNVPHVRDTIADRELETWIVVDRSASLDFGTAQCEKRDLALIAVGAVGFLTLRSANRIGAIVLAGEHGFHQPARSGRNALLALLHRIDGLPRDEPGATGAERLDAALARVATVARKRGLVVIVSDFLASPEWVRPVRALTARHDVLAIEVIDPRELELPDVGVLELIDTETGRRIEVQTASVKLRQRYAEAAAAQRLATANALRGAGADHMVLRTDRDWIFDIVQHVGNRRRRRAGRAGRAMTP